MNQEQDNNFNDVHHVDAFKDNGDISWLCPNCHTINQADKCVICGYVRKLKPVSRNSAINPWMVCSIVLIVLLLFSLCLLIGNASGDERNGGPSLRAVLCIGGHEFSDATCTEARICSTCGKTEGDPLGHDYSKATCAKASKCSRCGDVNGKPLSHKWVDATYESPKKCVLCGKTSGTVKGYYASLPGEWNTKRVSVGGTATTPFVFDKKVENCVKFTLHFQINKIKYGDIYGKFTVYGKCDGKWTKLGTYNVKDKSMVTKTLEFKDPITFTQLAFVGPQRMNCNYSFYLKLDDFYLHD